jgi:hypothetical protein
MVVEFELPELESYILDGSSAVSRASSVLSILESENMNVQNVVG